jgi:hypothetical protein
MHACTEHTLVLQLYTEILDVVLAAVDCAIMKSCPVCIADEAADRSAVFGTRFVHILQTLVQSLVRYR